MKKLDFEHLITKLNEIKFNDSNNENQVNVNLVDIFSSFSFDKQTTKVYIEQNQKELLLKNVEINREYTKNIDFLNKSFVIALEKNKQQINLYQQESEKSISLLRKDFLSKKRRSNLILDEENKSYQRIITENKKAYEEEIQHIQLEISEISRKSFLETQKLEAEKNTKLNELEKDYQNKVVDLNADLNILKDDYLEKTEGLKDELKTELKSKDESYLTIKKNHTQSSVKFNNFINEVKEKNVLTIQNLKISYENKVKALEEKIMLINQEHELEIDKIQNMYYEKTKALNVVFDVQKDVYNEKTAEIIKKNNEEITLINQNLRFKRESLNKQISDLEKDKWKEMSQTKDTTLRDEITKKYNRLIKPLNDQILEVIKHNTTNLDKQEIVFQTEFFNHDFNHIKQINEWRFTKNTYDNQKRIELQKLKALFDHRLFIYKEKINLENKILENLQVIEKIKLDKTLLPIESQLLIASYLQTREINLLNTEFETIRYNNELNQKLVEKEYQIERLKITSELSILKSNYNYNKRVLDVSYQLEIEKLILNRQNNISNLELNIELQASLLEQKNERYYKIYDGTVKRESYSIEKLNKEFLYTSRNLSKKAKIEQEKRNSIIQEIKSKNHRIISDKKINRAIEVAKNEVELRNIVNIYFFDHITNITQTEKILYDTIFKLFKNDEHPEIIRKTISLFIEYLDLLENRLKYIISEFILNDTKEFNQRIFTLTDYKYRLKHEEILNLYNEHISVVNENINELLSKQVVINNENDELSSKISQNEFLISSYKNNKDSTLNNITETITQLISDNKLFEISLKNNLKLERTIKKQLLPLNKSIEIYNAKLKQEEIKLETERKTEESVYTKYFQKHLETFNKFNTYLDLYYESSKKRYRQLFDSPYLNDTSLQELNDKFSLNYEKHSDKLLKIKEKLITFWLDIYLNTKNEQSIIAENFARSTNLAIKQSKSTYEKFILVDEKENTINKRKFEKETQLLNSKIEELSNVTLSNVKITHDLYNKIYALTEKKTNNNNELTNRKINLINENLEDALNNLLNKNNAEVSKNTKDYDKTNIGLLTDIILLKKEIQNNNNKNNIKINSIISKFENLKKNNLNNLKNRHRKNMGEIRWYENKNLNLENEYEQNIIKDDNRTKIIIKDFDYSFKRLKQKGRIDQHHLTKKERKVLKKSYLFKKKQISARIK